MNALMKGLCFIEVWSSGKCFIEYIPAENAWIPIEADGYIISTVFGLPEQ